MNNNFLNIYINSLTKLVNKNTISDEYDLIFDGGAFNGLMGQGVSLYINSLMKIYKFKVVRVSGCSIGALLATMFVSDIYYDLEEPFISLITSFKKTLLLNKYHSLLKKYIFSVFKTDDLSYLTNKLYISYWDMKKFKQIVVSKYRNRNHLLKILIRSSHIPYISTNELKYQGRFVDGISPYIFREKVRPTIFISLITRNLYSKALNIKDEYNTTPRILYGINDANNFFTLGKSDMCSYVSNWNIFMKLSLRFRQLLLCIIIFWLELFINIKNIIPYWWMNSLIIKGLINIFKQVYIDIMDHLIH
jgi:hypothetical protein|tara:strand:+ start:424 stop:1338 length:915 start_codon:yes stop_codon:yes gene_type:complete